MAVVAGGKKQIFAGRCPLLAERNGSLQVARLTEQERRRQHLGIVGALPPAVLEVRGKSEDVVL